MARLITRMNRGGPARTILCIEPLLRERGVETLLIAGPGGVGEDDLAPQAEALGIRVHTLADLVRAPAPWRDVRARRRLRRVLDEFAPDVVHSHTFKAGLLARSLERRPPYRRVHTFHGHVFRGYYGPVVSGLLVRLERCLARRTDRLVTVSPTLREELAVRYRIAPADRIEVIPGVVTPEVEPDGAIPPLSEVRGDRGPCVGCVARLVPIKAPLRFLELAHRVQREVSGARFVWVGDGPLREAFLAERRRLGLEQVVTLAGWQTRTGPWHRRFDVEVLLSDSEGLPVSLLEARAAGTPVVASRVGGVGDLIRDGEDGFLVEPGDHAAAADRVLTLLRDPQRAAGLAARARQADQDRYSAEAHVSRLLAMYGALLGAGEPSRMPDR